MWERRYGVVGPQTSPRGHRRYSADDVGRLATIKALVDHGHPIGTLAHLPLAMLREMRAAPGVPAAEARPPAEQTHAPLRVAIVGESLAAQAESASGQWPSLEIVAVCARREDAIAAWRGVTADVVAIEVPALRDDSVSIIDALTAAVNARRALVIYRFAAETVLRELRRRGHGVARAPVSLAEIESLAAPAAGVHESGLVDALPAPPRFDERTLAHLAQASTTVRCECPRHVVDLLMSIGAFERYSAECENRSPADAALHRFLGRVAGAARVLFEEALVRVAEAEGIALPQHATQTHA